MEDNEPQPQEQAPPPPPPQDGSKRMSVASRAFDRGNKGYLDKDERRVRSYDLDGDGKLDIDDVFRVVADARQAESRRNLFRWLLTAAVAFAVLNICAVFGLTFVVVSLTREVAADPNTNHLLNARNGQPLVVDGTCVQSPFSVSVSVWWLSSGWGWQPVELRSLSGMAPHRLNA